MKLIFLIFLIILQICVLAYLTPLMIFSFFNKDAMEEYYRIHEENRLNGGENIDHNKMLYTRLVYSGMVAIDDKIQIKYGVVHPYDIFLKDREKYGAKITTWSRDAPSYRSYEGEAPPLIYGSPSSDEKQTDDSTQAPIPIDSSIWFI